MELIVLPIDRHYNISFPVSLVQLALLRAKIVRGVVSIVYFKVFLQKYSDHLRIDYFSSGRRTDFIKMAKILKARFTWIASPRFMIEGPTLLSALLDVKP